MPNPLSETEQLKFMISAQRLKPLIRKPDSDQKAIDLHQDILRLGSSLLVVIATIEIALRNSVCGNLSEHFGASDWFLRPPLPFQWRAPEKGKITAAIDSAKRAEYSKLLQAEKHALDSTAFPAGRPQNTTHLARSKARRKHIAITEGKVVAELTLFFWKRLFGPEYEHSLWKPSLKRTFPNKNVSRANVAIHLETIYQTRNRLAHHEPVISHRFIETIQAVDFVVQHLETATPSNNSPLSKLLNEDIKRSQVIHDMIISQFNDLMA